MSRYKTPLIIEYATRQKLAIKSCRYQLPFKKDEPFEDRQFALVKTDKDQFMITSDIKLPKVMTILNSNRASQVQSQSVKRSSVGLQFEINENEQILANKKEEDKELVVQVNQNEIEQYKIMKEQREGLMPKKIESTIKKSLSPFGINNKKRRRYLSAVDKYPNESCMEADYSQNSQYAQINSKPDRNSCNELAIIDQKQKFKTEIEEEEGEGEEDQRIKEWSLFAKRIRQYKQQKTKQEIQKRKLKTKSKKKLFNSLSKNPKLKINDRQAIQQQITKIRLAKCIKALSQDKSNIFHVSQKLSVNNRSTLLPKDEKPIINLNSPNIAIEKIKKSLEFKPIKCKTTKGKLPLQFYMPSYELIKQINPFFRKISQFGGCILLSIGKLIYLEAGKSIYCEGDNLNEIYIIIYGKILLTNKYETLKDYASTGETLGEEELFEGQKSYIQRLKQGYKTQTHREKARTVKKCCLLKIGLRKYYKMYRHLQRAGCKQLFNLIDNLFRINYIKKLGNQHPNSHADDRMVIDTLSCKSNRKSGFF